MMQLFRRRQTTPVPRPKDSRWLHELHARAANSEDVEVVADLAKVEIIDSNELGELVKIHLQLRRNDRNLVLENVPTLVREVFEMTRVDRLVNVR